MSDPTRSLAAAFDVFPAVAILRGCEPRVAGDVAAVAVEAGFNALEVTLDSPRPLQSIELIATVHGDLQVGAGTVHTAAEVSAVASIGASFVVSPIVNREVIEACLENGLAVLPGAATPTEVAWALELGAVMVKLFPAEQLGGPRYLSAILGPLRRPQLVPTGGITAANARAFLDSGAVAVGVGGSVFGAAARNGDLDTVSSLAKAFVRSIQ